MRRQLFAIPIACFGLWAMRSVTDGVYTAEQAKRGADTYASRCAMCHGGEMQGGPEAPALIGAEFQFSWGGKTAGALYNYIHASMPPNEQGTLSGQRCADVLAAIFQKNQFPAGQSELPADAKALTDLVIPKDKP
jgi:mono/diheme cytochrome c family protein